MTTAIEGLDRYLLITADTHAGSSPEGYGPYLEQEWQAEFQDWLKQSAELAKVMRKVMGDRSIGVDGDREPGSAINGLIVSKRVTEPVKCRVSSLRRVFNRAILNQTIFDRLERDTANPSGTG